MAILFPNLSSIISEKCVVTPNWPNVSNLNKRKNANKISSYLIVIILSSSLLKHLYM